MAKGGRKPNARGANAGKMEKAAEKRVRALDLRKRGLPYSRIAQELGVSVSTAHGYIAESLSELAALEKDKADTLRQLEVERLTEAIEHVQKTIAACDTAGDEGADLRLKAVDRLVRLSERLSKLCGLDAPERQDLTTDGRAITFNIGEAKRDGNDG